MKPTSAILSLLTGLVACNPGSSSNPVKEIFTLANIGVDGGAAVVFRFSTSGGRVRLYRLPNLEEVTWQFEMGRHRTRSMIGFAGDDDLIYALAERSGNSEFSLVALDLVTGRARSIDSTVTAATIGPTGIAYVVRPDGTVGQVEHRTADIWPDTLQGSVALLSGAARGRLLAVMDSDSARHLSLLARGQLLPGERSRISQPLPAGALAVSKWGQALAVAVDSGLVIVDPGNPDSRGFVPISPQPRLVTFSASGHQLFVVTGTGNILVLDSYSRETVGSMTLPGRIAAMRTGPLGRTLLAYSADDSMLWVVDPIELALRASVECSWDADLPTVAPDGSVLVRRAGNLVVLGGAGLEVIAQSEAGGDDRWLVTQWDPRRPTLELARDSVPEEDEAGRIIYVQISSSRNVAWAQAFADELSSAGMPAIVLPADSTDQLYRVVLGPFSSREEAEQSARRLDRPFFIREIDRPIP